MFVLKILDYFSPWDCNVVEVYTSDNRWSSVVNDMTLAGFRRVSVQGLCRRPGTTACAIFATTKSGFIKVFRSANHSPVFPLAFFRHTLLMNYASFDHICVAYPGLTLYRRGVVTSRMLDGADRIAVETDRGNGYDIQTCVETGSCGSSPTCPKTLRSVRDTRCCMIRFTGRDVRLPRYMVEWRLGGSYLEGCHGCSSLYVRVKEMSEVWL